MLWFRPDGDVVKDVPATRRIMPFLMPTRNESMVLFEMELDAHAVDRRVSALVAAGARATVLHVVVAAAVRTLRERPRLNRFVAGGRLWQRRGVWISMSGKREKGSDDAPVAVSKRRFDDGDDLAAARVVNDSTAELRSTGRTRTDTELSLVLALPNVMLAMLIRLVRALDAWGLLPRAYIDGDPMFASMFIANLGSLGMDAAHHHLYEYGNIPIFCVIGQARDSFFVDDDGAVRAKKVYPLRFTFDERIEDGLYCLRALERFKHEIETP